MKLIVQIPCFNEEETLPQTVADIPSEIYGVDTVEVLIIDDGSSDRTIEVARRIGVDHIVVNKNNQGLARSFRNGLDACLRLNADIIVNTDGDNQYAGKDIPKLIHPILQGEADIVIGDRQTDSIPHFSKNKKLFQRLGSGIVRRLSGTDVPDVVSGFRAYSREAAFQMNIVSSFSYTIETVIQAGAKRMAITSVPVDTNAKTRESRLFSSVPKFIEQQMNTIIRMYSMYKALRLFLLIGVILSLVGLVPIVRFLFFYFSGEGSGHIQSLVIGGTFVILGFMSFMFALLADLVGFNRQLIEIVLEKVRRMEMKDNPDPESE